LRLPLLAVVVARCIDGHHHPSPFSIIIVIIIITIIATAHLSGSGSSVSSCTSGLQAATSLALVLRRHDRDSV
jgi:hypothetical protein